MKFMKAQVLLLFLLIGCSQTEIVKVDNIQPSNVLAKSNSQNLQTSNGNIGQLQTLVEIAIRNNPEISATEYELQAEIQLIHAVQVNPDPRIDINYALLPIETRNGPIIGGLKISQRFLSSGNLKSISAIQHQNSLIKMQNLLTLKIQIELYVKQTFYNIYLIDRRIEIADLHLKLLRKLEKIMKVKFSTGKITQVDILKLQNEILRIKTDIEILIETRLTAVAKLNTILGRNIDTKIEILMKQEPLQKLSNIETIIENALSENPKIKAKQDNITKAMKRIEHANSAYKPDYTVALQYQMINEGDSNSSDKGKDNLVLSFSLNLPIFRKWRNANKNAAKYNLASSKYKKTQHENLLILEITEQYLRRISAQKRLSLLNEVLIPRANQILRVTESAYIAGKSDYTNLSEALRNLFTYRLQQEEAYTEYLLSIAMLSSLQGFSSSRNITNEVK